jgi:hypothetical protein
MGLMKSTQFKRNDDIPGQGKALLLMAKRLGLRTNEVDLPTLLSDAECYL